MSTSNNKKNKRILVLLFITISMSFLNINQFIWNRDNSLIDSDSRGDLEFLRELKISDYSPSFNNNGENMNITLHQSYLNNSYNTLLNTSDSNSNKFILPSPTDVNFNSSYTYMYLESIYAPNKSIVIETGTSGTENIWLGDNYFSFTIEGDSYLENFSLCFDEYYSSDGSDCDIQLQIMTSRWFNSRIEPYTLVSGSTITDTIPNGTSTVWFNYINKHISLDVSQTYENTFFIRLIQTTATTVARSRYHNENNGAFDDSIVYKDELGSLTLKATDPSLTMDFAPLNNTPKPSEVNLKIDSYYVSDLDWGSGFWESYDVNSSVSGELQYNIYADWFEVTCQLSQVLINFTKHDLRAISEFNIAGTGQIVNWNVTRNGGLNYFDSNFNNYQINLTIPDTWDENSIKVFNGSTPKTPDCINRSLGNGYREVNILHAGNGTYWYLTADSSNLLSSIDTYIGSNPATTFNFTNVVHCNATFSEVIGDGSINFSVYSPALINNELNYSIKVDSFSPDSVIFLTDWDISDNVTQYGKFRIQVYWKNNTAAGFIEKIITILGETELIPSLPAGPFDASDIFTLYIFYNDTGLDAGIDTADITYSLNGGLVRSDDTPLGNGNYSITIDCSDSDFTAYGFNSIEINASKIYYHNQSITEQIVILGETDITGSIPKYSFNSTETFDVSLFYNDTVKDIGIDGGTIEVYINETLYNPVAINDYADGNYNITINCDDDVFDTWEYGYFNLTLEIEKSYYYNQSIEFIIHITGETSLEVTKYPDPAIGYYNSDETFNVTAYFKDIGRNEGINGGLVKVYVKELSASSYQEYTTTIIPFGIGYYNFTIDCSDSIFSNYGKYNIKINVTKSNYYLADYILEELVIGNTTLTILEPTGIISYVEGETFDIQIEYMDHTQSAGIVDANITYTLNGTGYRSDNVLDNYDGTYNITINANDSDFGLNFGSVNVIIRANKSKFINLTRTLNFERRILTQLTPPNPPSLIQVIRGNSVFYEFNYSDRLGTPIDTYDTFQNSSNLQRFQWSLVNEGGGNYTLELNTTNVIVSEVAYVINFTIYKFGNQPQEISFTILVTIIETKISIQSWNEFDDFARSTRFNISIDFYFNDTTNNQPITDITDSDIKVKNNISGIVWSPGFELFDRPGDGNYKLNISTIGATSGFYTLQVNVSKFPNYNWDIVYVQFYLRGNYTKIHLISMSDPSGILISESANYNFTIFEGSDINIEFNLTDLEFGEAMVLGGANSYNVWYYSYFTPDTGSLLNTLHFVYQNVSYGTHMGQITTSNTALTPGNYLVNITLTKTNYESTFFAFNLTVIEKYQVRVNIQNPTEVDAGDSITIILNAEYFNGTVWLPLSGTNIQITPYFNGLASTEIQTKSTNATGGVSFQITVRSDAKNMNVSIELQEEYYHYSYNSMISDIDVNPLPSGLNLEDLMPYIIIAGIALAVAGGSIAVYRGVIVPKKREKSRVLKEVKTIFDDAINLEHILVLYKATGTCIYFKSFGSEGIDPELISGFISAICSFGKDLVCQEELNEINYGDKMLLLSDGEFIRVALVLSKKASIILRKNLMEFIDSFEKAYSGDLPNWRGQLNIFRDSGTMIDELLSTSIILPHEITYDYSNVKALKNPHSKDVLKVANNMMKESERNFFFIATLLKEASEKTNKDTAEIFMGIKELRDKKMLIPIEIGAIEAQPISQQELNLINQKINQLVNLSQEEKQKLANDLAQMGPAEREAYFVSLSEQHEIISAPIEEKPGTTLIDNIKVAKKEIKNLKKIAKNARKEKDYTRTINICQNAINIATTWELIGEVEPLNEFIRSTKIEDLGIKMKNLEKEAKLAAKEKNYNEAAQKYKMSSKIASEIFKLGGTEMTKEVKRLSNKSKEYEKLI